MNSLADPDRVVRVVFATMALGMGLNFSGLRTTIHYGAPRSLDDYFQESGRAGRHGEQSNSTIFWKPSDAPLKSDQTVSRNVEVSSVRRFVESTTSCRRHMLLTYFDPAVAKSLPKQNPLLCCDNCKASISTQSEQGSEGIHVFMHICLMCTRQLCTLHINLKANMYSHVRLTIYQQ